MAIAFVSGAKNSAASAATNTVTYAPTAGHAVIVFLNVAGAITAITVKDNLGNTLTAGPTVTNTTQIASFYYFAPSGVTSFVATWTTSRTSSLVAAEYSGAAFINASLSGNTATGSSTAPTITVTTNDSNNFVVAGLGDAALTFTATTGTSREQVTTTPRMLALDNTVASAGSVTCAASSSTTAWTAVAIELRTRFQQTLTDQLIFADAFNKLLGIPGQITEQLGDQIVMSDGTGQPLTFDYQMTIICPHLSQNWLDAFVDSLGGGSTPLTESLSDALSMSDFMLLGYGALNSDQLILTDSLNTGYAGLLSDIFVFTDSALIGYGNLIADQLVMSDADVLLLGLAESLTDQISMTDFMQAGYGMATSDQLILTDSLGAGYAALLSDNLNNWLDSASFAMVLSLTFTDQLVFLDFVTAGYGNVFNDQLILSDSLGAGYGGLFNDQIVLSDVLGVGYGNSFSDQMVFTDAEINQLGLQAVLADSEGINWGDKLGLGYGNAVADQLTLIDAMGVGYGLSISDNDNFWTDAFSFSFGGGLLEQLSDSLVMADFMTAGYGSATSDQLILIDSLNAGYGGVFVDTMTLTDNFADIMGMLETLSDNEGPNWSDQLRLGYGSAFADQITMTDSMLAGYGLANSDQLVLVDSLKMGYGFILSDNEGPNWADQFDFSAGGGFNLQLLDDLVMQDFLGAGYGNLQSDQLILVDSLNAGYGNVLVDAMTLTDAEKATLGMLETLTDSLAFTESLLLGYGNLINEQIVLTDAFNESMNTPALQESLNDAMSMTDFMGAGYGLVIFDNDNFWNDSLNFNENAAQMTEILNDALTMSDFLRAGYGNAVADQIVLVESLNTGYGGLFTDALTLNDSSVIVLGLIQALTDDDGGNWADFIPSFTLDIHMLVMEAMLMVDNYQDFLNGTNLMLGVSDDLVMTDSLVELLNTPNFALGLVDDMVMADSFIEFLQGSTLFLGVADAMQQVDSLGLGYGYLVHDSTFFWNDAVAEQLNSGSSTIQFAFTDALNQLDSFASLLTGLTLPLLVYKVGARPSLTINSVEAQPSLQLYKAATRMNLVIGGIEIEE